MAFSLYEEVMAVILYDTNNILTFDKSLWFQSSKINTQNFHYSVATPLIELLIKEIKEALFDVKKLM